jgi:hypothetical protein
MAGRRFTLGQTSVAVLISVTHRTIAAPSPRHRRRDAKAETVTSKMTKLNAWSLRNVMIYINKLS